MKARFSRPLIMKIYQKLLNKQDFFLHKCWLFLLLHYFFLMSLELFSECTFSVYIYVWFVELIVL